MKALSSPAKKQYIQAAASYVTRDRISDAFESSCYRIPDNSRDKILLADVRLRLEECGSGRRSRASLRLAASRIVDKFVSALNKLRTHVVGDTVGKGNN
jgi:hypothetical protein